jgi:hypothetical protein
VIGLNKENFHKYCEAGGCMKFGFLIHSQSGNTLSIAHRLSDVLTQKGHEVFVTHIKSRDVNRSMQFPQEIEIVQDNLPEEVDVLFVGGWVQAFSLCRGLQYYLNHFNVRSNEINLFLTHHFPYEWMGGTNAMKQLKRLVLKANVKVVDDVIFNWSRKNNQNKIQEWIEKVLVRY